MKRALKILTVSCLFAAFAGTMTAQAAAEKSPHQVALVMAQEDYSNIAVSQVTDYVNIREQETTGSRIVGKIYNNCAATILETVEGEGGKWYRIQSGTVTGYMKAQYFITGAEAERLALSIGREFVTINTESLRLREHPDLSSRTLTLLSAGARYVVQGDEGDFYKVEVDADLIGYIAKSYCRTEVEFDQAVSLEEERQQLADEAERKREAESAMAALEQVKRVEAKKEAESGMNAAAGNIGVGVGSNVTDGASTGSAGYGTGTSGQLVIAANPEKSDNSQQASAPAITVVQQPMPGGTGAGGILSGNAPSGGTVSSGTSNTVTASKGPGSAAVVSATRTAIVAYAKQFLGNPYVYGGASLTDGADCSGFTQQIYAHFGITTGRSSRDQAVKGKEIAVSSAQPGDLLFYASGDIINHVALYIGNGQVIHASNPTTGIVISPYNYRTPCKAVTFLD